MLGGDPEERGDVVVVEPVVDDAAVAVARDEPKRAQASELMAHGRLRHAEDGGEVAGAERPGLEGCEEPEPGRIAERSEERARAVEVTLAVRQPGAGGVHGVRVDAADGAVEGAC